MPRGGPSRARSATRPAHAPRPWARHPVAIACAMLLLISWGPLCWHTLTGTPARTDAALLAPADHCPCDTAPRPAAPDQPQPDQDHPCLDRDEGLTPGPQACVDLDAATPVPSPPGAADPDEPGRPGPPARPDASPPDRGDARLRLAQTARRTL